MTIELSTAAVADLDGVIRALEEWQYDDAPSQLHSGDVGWFWRSGAEATAAAVRTWRRDGRVLAAGLLDGPTVLRLAIAPDALDDEELARQLVVDVADPDRGVLTEQQRAVAAPEGALVRDRLGEAGWLTDEPWTPLIRDLTEPVADTGLRIEMIGPERVPVRTEVQRASFEGSTFTDERWHAMAGGPAYAEARCLVAFDDADHAVAAATVWSAGPGKPGLLEPVGVHRDHRRHGYGRAISLASAAALRELGSSSATVCTRSANVAAVATYASAGFRELPATCDLRADR